MLRRSLATAAVMVVSPWALAQVAAPPLPGVPDIGAGRPQLAGPPPRVWIEPRVFLTQTYSDNYLLTTTNRQSEWVTEIGAGVTAVFNMPRLKGSLDYALSGLYHARGVAENERNQDLRGRMLLDAWNNTAFVEVDGAIADERVSAFGTQTVNGNNPVNRSETRRFRVSPFLRGLLDDAYEYELRYTLLTQSTDVAGRPDLDERGWNGRIASAEGLSRLGWELSTSTRETDYNIGAEPTEYRDLLALVRYDLSPTLRVYVQGGREQNNLLTPDNESYTTHTLGADWRPVERARIAVSRSKRFFGNGHSLQMEYQMRRVLLRFTDERDFTTGRIGGDEGSLAGFLDDLYRQQQPDPVLRAQLVQAELQRLGLSGDLTTIPAYLTSSAAVERNQQVAMVVLTARGAVTFTIERSTARRLDTGGIRGDDFDLSDEIRQKGWSVSYAHRLTPRTSLGLSYQRRDATGQFNSSLDTRVQSAAIGLTTRLGWRSTGSLQLRHTQYDSTSPYRENSIEAALVHRF